MASKVTGIIPAHARSTLHDDGLTPNRQDHPRSRGEHWRVGSVTFQNTGSSPLTRGALRGAYVRVLFHGIIPAHAGSTSLC